MSKNKIEDIELLETVESPEILITPEAYNDMRFIIEEGGKEEISWLGSVKQTQNVYLIDRIFLFLQECDHSSIEISSEDVMKFVSEKLKNGNACEKGCMTRLRFWGHTHPFGSTKPSHCDEKQMGVFKDNQYFIRGIFSKEEACSFSFFDYKKGLKYNFGETNILSYLNIERDEKRRAEIKSEIAHKVSKIIPFIRYTRQEVCNDYMLNTYYERGY